MRVGHKSSLKPDAVLKQLFASRIGQDLPNSLFVSQAPAASYTPVHSKQ